MMNAETNNVATNSETLTSAMDVINLHPDGQDVMNINNEIDDATEVFVNSYQSFNGNYLSCNLQNILLNPEETRTSTAFYGPNEKKSKSQRR